MSFPPSSSAHPLKPAPFLETPPPFAAVSPFPPSSTTSLKLNPPPSAHAFSFPSLPLPASPAARDNLPQKGCGRDGRRHTPLLPPLLKIQGIKQQPQAVKDTKSPSLTKAPPIAIHAVPPLTTRPLASQALPRFTTPSPLSTLDLLAEYTPPAALHITIAVLRQLVTYARLKIPQPPPRSAANCHHNCAPCHLPRRPRTSTDQEYPHSFHLWDILGHLNLPWSLSLPPFSESSKKQKVTVPSNSEKERRNKPSHQDDG
ncbi:hypothetical protein Salat_1456300 [Sesamum alatum]|uniref:Uncharacterized protein n=1 Tax=Sesamum alatum TaxID=300844 RepID=A0AAE2CLR7_9LAMI|nr:hypothetical protein Salat_1456300 [Sesamum alatum]